MSINPLIGDNHAETVANAAEALSSIMCLLAESQNPHYRSMFMVLTPVSHALTYAATNDSDG